MPHSSRGSSGAPSPAPVAVRGLSPSDREPLLRILRAVGNFTDDEVAVALELIDDGLSGRDPSYRFVVAEDGGRVAGYACFGRTPMTLAAWDLYWIAVDPAAQGRGVGAALDDAVRDAVAREGGGIVVAETASKPSYDGTRAFYVRRGWAEEARLRDFYRPGDDKVVYVIRLPAVGGSAPGAPRGG